MHIKEENKILYKSLLLKSLIETFYIIEIRNKKIKVLFNYPESEIFNDFILNDQNYFKDEEKFFFADYVFIYKFTKANKDESELLNSLNYKIVIDLIKKDLLYEIEKKVSKFNSLLQKIINHSFKVFFISLDEVIKLIDTTIKEFFNVKISIYDFYFEPLNFEIYNTYDDTGNQLMFVDTEQKESNLLKLQKDYNLKNKLEIKFDNIAGIKGNIIFLYEKEELIDWIKDNINIKNKFKETLFNIFYKFVFIKEHLEYMSKLEDLISEQKEEIKTKNLLLLNQLSKLSAIEKSKAKLLTNIYHELLTPLNSIIGFSIFINSFQKENLNKELIEDVKAIESNALYLLYIILSVIEYTNLINNTLNYKVDVFSFLTIKNNIEKLINYFKTLFNINIDLSIEPEDFFFTFDSKKTEQIIFSFIYFLSFNKIEPIKCNINFKVKESISYIEINFNIPNLKKNQKKFDELRKLIKDPYSIEIKDFTLDLFFLYIAINLVYKSKNRIELVETSQSIDINLKIKEIT